MERPSIESFLFEKVEAQDQEKAQGLKDSSVQTRALEGF